MTGAQLKKLHESDFTVEEKYRVIGRAGLFALWKKLRSLNAAGGNIRHHIRLASDKRWVPFTLCDVGSPTRELIVAGKRTSKLTDYSQIPIRAVASDPLVSIIKRKGTVRIRDAGRSYWFEGLVAGQQNGTRVFLVIFVTRVSGRK